MRRKRIWLTGSLTVEMSLLMPLILLLLMSSILAVFYFHDKNILAGVAYETAAVAGTRAREEEGWHAGEMEALFRGAGRGEMYPISHAFRLGGDHRGGGHRVGPGEPGAVWTDGGEKDGGDSPGEGDPGQKKTDRYRRSDHKWNER